MEMLRAKWAAGRFVCVGLDPVWEKILPLPLKGLLSSDVVNAHEVTADFLINIIKETKDIVCAFKPNLAFYLCDGERGIHTLAYLCGHIKKTCPDVPIILDAKFGDIDKTNVGLVKFAFEYCEVDAVTVNPYVGGEALLPFLNQLNKGIIVLARTSNKGSGEFQDLYTLSMNPRHKPSGMADSEWLEVLCNECMPLYERVARHVATKWNKLGNCCVVVGATYPAEAEEIRGAVGDLPFLIPGIGTQGGDIEKTVFASRDGKAEGMIISSSSGIIFSKDPRAKTLELHNQVTACRLAQRYS